MSVFGQPPTKTDATEVTEARTIHTTAGVAPVIAQKCEIISSSAEAMVGGCGARRNRQYPRVTEKVFASKKQDDHKTL